MHFRLRILIAVIFCSVFYPSFPAATAASSLPSAPNSITQSAIAGGVRVTWSAPSDTATGILGYKIEYSTSGTSGTWFTSGNVSGNTYTYDVLGFNQVSLYIRVTASATAGYGTPGYPWTKLYRTTTKTRSGNDIVYETGFGVGLGNFSYNYNPSFTRIRYLMEDSFTVGNLNYADVDFYKWAASGASTETTTALTVAPTIGNLQVLSPTSQGTIQTNVSDLNVFSKIANTSYYPNSISNGTSKIGRLEIWPWNYATGVSTLKPFGNADLYDVGDTSSESAGYGSFQVHDITNGANMNTILAWNNHAAASVDIGFGNGISPTSVAAHEDWTFCGGSALCQQPVYFSLTIFINVPITTLLANSTTTLTAPVSGSKGISTSLTATSNLAGFYTFSVSGKRIAGCINLPTSGTGPFTTTCNWKPASQGRQLVTASFSNIALGYIGSSSTAAIFIVKRTTKR